jgi:hypothetical protein
MKLHKNFWQIIFTVLLLVAIGLMIWFIVDLKGLYQTGHLRPTRGFGRNHVYKQTINPDQIQGWMTFSYINYIFSIPPDYLSVSLAIQDSHYPNLGISQYAKTKSFNAADFLKKVQEAVTQYAKGNQ